jgi:hypothetical protein
VDEVNKDLHGGLAGLMVHRLSAAAGQLPGLAAPAALGAITSAFVRNGRDHTVMPVADRKTTSARCA